MTYGFIKKGTAVNGLADENAKRELYLRQKELLDTFLRTHAISKAQYNKSLSDLTEKMGMKTE